MFSYPVYQYIVSSYFFTVYEIKLGTIENADTADVEWVHRPYMITAKKRRHLAAPPE